MTKSLAAVGGIMQVESYMINVLTSVSIRAISLHTPAYNLDGWPTGACLGFFPDLS